MTASPAKESSRRTESVSGKSRVFLVDDHTMFREGLRQLIEREATLTVCGDAPDAAEALNGIRASKPDVVIVDISLAGGSGIDLIRDIKAEFEDLPVLVVSMHDEALYAERALRAGARGYVMKREALDSILQAVRSVLDGELYISPTMTKRMVFDHIQGGGEARSAVERLTDRELEIFQLIGEGRDMHEIAGELHLS